MSSEFSSSLASADGVHEFSGFLRPEAIRVVSGITCFAISLRLTSVEGMDSLSRFCSWFQFESEPGEMWRFMD